VKSLHYKNITLSYSDEGKGNAVVLLHGFLENSKMWLPFVTEFSKKYRVITIDLLGHGKTEPRGYVHTMEDNADIVHAVLQELKIRKAFFAGHSMGGYVALAFAELYPDNIRGIALINSTARPDSEERKVNRDRAIKAVKENYNAFVRMSIANLFSEDNREKLSEEIEKVRDEALKTPLQGIVASLEGMKMRNDREVLLHFGPYPILLVLGEKDPVLNYQENVTQAEGSRVKLVTFPDGHMSPIENYADLVRVLSVFFRQV
jgi:pimeloyl-ACP methyl ester carboxylesterase